MNKKSYIIAAILIASIATIVFFCFFDLKEQLGVTGDYFGGILNPIFVFLSLLAILSTLKLQSNELELTREELKNNLDVQKKSERHFAEQSRILQIQQFENTFFSLLTQTNNTIKEYINKHTIEEKSSHSSLFKNTIIDELKRDIEINIEIGANNFMNVNGEKNSEKRKNEIIRRCLSLIQNNLISYDEDVIKVFMLIYRLLKYIDDHELINNSEKKSYSGILRAGLGANILWLISINCCREDLLSINNFKILIEKYAILEHMPFDFTYKDKTNGYKYFFSVIKNKYDKKAFGDNEYLIKLEKYEKANGIDP